MKKICVVWITGIILLISAFAKAQDNNVKKTEVIQPELLDVTFSKTVNIIYPYAIKSVDKGSKDLLVQVAKGVENILQVKAAVQGFSETTLTVITADGKLYSYVVSYSQSPSLLNIKVDQVPGIKSSDARFSITNDNEASIQDYGEQVALKKAFLKKGNENSAIKMVLSGIYIHNQQLYFQIALSNNSNIDYDIDQLRFYIRDQKKSKRTASQETELQPVQVTGNARIIRGSSEQTIVVTLPKFTIPDKKYLTLQLMEDNGGRNIELDIKNKLLIRARGL
ncbi:Bacteroides conjugative transposon TraN protein [Mucilaginibacter gossypiicola]|uniref:Bacteroides conjugative transposon TraN protein n=1 Tax=Mucilaginibacter gossypiicola TaxID=551995 RepID=A0A1H8HMH1_9SPHI|nr:conjugative transposon protein TraN [Mucilaginibacter gossypiicola]SEN57410.1 Bacteroides conjugative transposon TraN protein [Mucilaginibacter gossypiicola]